VYVQIISSFRPETEFICRMNTTSMDKTSNPNHPLNNLPSHKSKP